MVDPLKKLRDDHMQVKCYVCKKPVDTAKDHWHFKTCGHKECNCGKYLCAEECNEKYEEQRKLDMLEGIKFL